MQCAGVAADLSACKVKYVAISAATALTERRFYSVSGDPPNLES